MLELRVYNVITQVHYSDPQANALLFGLLCYREPNYYFSPAYKQGIWDGYMRLYNQPTNFRKFGKFWTGLLYRARTILADHNVDFRIVDCRQRPDSQEPIPVDPETLWEHGHGAVKAVMERTRGVVKIATAGGKTRFAAHLNARLNLPSLFVVHRDSLYRQALKDFKNILQRPVGEIKGGRVKIERFNIATIQSLHSKLYNATHEDLKKFVEDEVALVMIDEGHHAKAQTYRYVLQRLQMAYYRVGLSGTPHRREDPSLGSDLHVEGAFGRIIYEAGRELLEEKGIVVPVKAFFV